MSHKNRGLIPQLSDTAKEFQDAAANGEFLLRHCNDCHELHTYPRSHCPVCGSRNIKWRQASGKARIYSYTIMEGAKRATAPAIIDLDEGLRLNSVIFDADVHKLKIGDPVQVAFSSDHENKLRLAFTTPQAQAARVYTEQALTAVINDKEGFAGSQPPQVINRVAVIGAGNMGIGIATAFLKSGFSVLLIDQSPEAFNRAFDTIRATLERDVVRKRITQERVESILVLLECSTDIARVSEVDLVVEAVWENIELKREIFAKLDQYARPEVCLCSNTSTLDIDQIAQSTLRPDQVVGLHFFNPAHVMKLLEVVRGEATSDKTLAIATQVGEKLGKVSVVVGNAHGFVGNRLMITREREAARLLLEGALPQQIDSIQRRFGMPMGTFEMQDMAGGIELSYRARQATGEKSPVIDRLFEAGRLGQKNGKGYYRYEPGKKRPIVDAEVTRLIEEASAAEGVTRRTLSDTEIEDRLILPMINEGAKLIENGIARRPSDIDIVWQTGFGWPSWKGGPMYHADRLGIEHVYTRLTELHDRLGERFAPSSLLKQMAENHETFCENPLPSADQNMEKA